MGTIGSYDQAAAAIARAVARLATGRAPAGYWPDCFDTGAMPAAQMAIGLSLLAVHDRAWTEALVQQIAAGRRTDGSWGLYPGSDPDLSTTVECEYALRLYGGWDGQPQQWRQTRCYIAANGGVRKCRNLTKVLLAVAGEIGWSRLPSPRVYSLLFSAHSPIRISDLVTFTRLHVAPMLLLSAVRYRVDRPFTPVPVAQLSPRLRRCLHWMQAQREANGTMAGYHSSTLLTLLALQACGESSASDDPQRVSALAALRRNLLRLPGDWRASPSPAAAAARDGQAAAAAARDGQAAAVAGCGFHQQTCNAHVWNTALAMIALRAAGVPHSAEVLRQAAVFLLAHQQRPTATAAGQSSPGGGWAFSDDNQRHPDTDDTVACLDALYPYRAACQARWWQGVRWLLGMQNRDGGWSAFDRDADKRWLEWLPANDMRHAMCDPSTPDITGRVLELLLRYKLLAPSAVAVQRAVRWLLRRQERDGSWFGRWGTTYLYGTWCAVNGLCAAQPTPPVVAARQRAGAWLLHVQRADGSYGESCASDPAGRYVPHATGVPTQTAWALDALVRLQPQATSADERRQLRCASDRAARWLLAAERQGRWSDSLPTGSAFPGALHIRYHMYPQVWPLLALSHYHPACRPVGVMSATQLAAGLASAPAARACRPVGVNVCCPRSPQADM